MKPRLVILSLLFAFIYFMSCVSTANRERVRIYSSGLEPMMDKSSEEVVSKLIDTWGFYCTKIWTTEDPKPYDIIKEAIRGIEFTGQEASRIFSIKGKYKVMLFFKYLSSETVSTDTIVARGTTSRLLEGRGRYQDERYTYIRVVFRDDRLVFYKIWPSLSMLHIKRNMTKENDSSKIIMGEI